jgi:hypothetical protein
VNRWRLAGAAAAVVMAAVLVFGDRGVRDEAAPAPEPDVTTATTRPPLRTWAVAPLESTADDVYDSYELRNVTDLGLGRRVVQLHRTGGDLAGATLYDDLPTDGFVQAMRFDARVQVVGDGVAHLSLVAIGESGVLAEAHTPEGALVRSGDWQERSVELLVPAGTVRLAFYIAILGTGDLLVDGARLETVTH